MAIDLNFQLVPVQRAQQEDPAKAAQGALIKVEAAKQAGDIATSALKTYESLRWERQKQAGMVQFHEAQAESAKGYAREYYTTEDVKGTELEGTKQEGERFAQWEAVPAMRKRDSLANAEQVAKGISGNRRKQQYLNQQKIAIQQQYKQDIEAAAEIGIQASKDELLNIVREYAVGGGHDVAIKMMEQSLLFSKADQQKYIQELEKDAEIFEVDSVMVQAYPTEQTIETAERLIEKLGGNEYGGVLSQPEREAQRKRLESKLNDWTLKADKAGKTITAINFTVLDERIENRDPEVTDAYLRNELESGRISESEYKTLSTKARKFQREEKEEVEKRSIWAAMTMDGYQSDMTPENRKFMDEDFEESVKAIRMEKGEELTNADIDMIALQSAVKTGMVPTYSKNIINGASPENPEQIVRAAQVYNVIKERASNAMRDLPEGEQGIVASVAAHIRLGADPIAATESVIASRNRSKYSQEVLDNQLKLAIGDTSPDGESASLDFLQEKLSEDPDLQIPRNIFDEFPETQIPGTSAYSGINPVMAAEFNGLVRMYAQIDGIIPVAMERAYDAVKKKYGRSNLNDPDAMPFGFGQRGYQIMAYPMPSDPTSTKLIRNDIETRFGDAAKAHGVSPDKILIFSDDATLQSGGVNPTYPLMVEAEDGTWQVIGRYAYNKTQIKNSHIERAKINRVEQTKERIRRQQDINFHTPSAHGDRQLKLLKSDLRKYEAALDNGNQ